MNNCKLSYIKQDFKNIYLSIRFWFIRNFNKKRFYNTETPVPCGYEINFFDFFERQKKLDGNKWTLGPTWGDFHPDDIRENRAGVFLKDPESIFFSEDGINLALKRKNTIVDLDKNPYTLKYIGGSIQQKIELTQKYGYFECLCKLPSKGGCWPAFWSYGTKNWPPEIDQFEYWNLKNANRIKSGIISSKEKGKILYKGDKFFFPRKGYTYIGKDNLQKRFNKFAFEWDENRIRMYFNGILIHEITQFAEFHRDETQYITLGIGFDENSGNWNYGDSDIFTIKWIKTYKKA